MPLEQIKTQVLLLHSEQSTLDQLSAGFSDRYTVHCATSGFDALNTLGETPIHVIVSANDLPGMSGAEALREAKKRSPETVAILLAGSDESTVEAVAGDKELFQVVRGGIDPKNITKMIDAATQQMRLMTMSESANDQSADEGTAEHIVMETSDNGSAIVSDLTGSHRTLDIEDSGEHTAIGAQAVAVLVMTKDEDFLNTIKECCRGMHTVHYANTIKQAQDLIRNNPVGVSIVDAAMVGPNVEKLTQHLQQLKPRLVSIVGGRREDGDMLMDLINRGKVYRFLLKPVSPGRARLAVEASVKHHLDSPDTAFKQVKEKGAAEASPAPTSTPTPKPKPTPAPAAEKPQKAKAPKPEPELPPDNVIEDNLTNAFDDDDSRFAETVTSIVTAKSKTDSHPIESPFLNESDSGDTGSPLGNPAVLGGIAAALVAVIGIGLWFAFGSSDDVAQPVTVQQPEPVASKPVEEASQPETSPPVSSEQPAVEASTEIVASETGESSTGESDELTQLLADAATARADGRLFSPVGDNALEYMSTALSLDANNPDVSTEFTAVLEDTLVAIEAALLEGRFAVVRVGIDQVSLVKPDHPRLPFLMAQVSQGELRTYLDQARDAIRRQRFEDAAQAIASARSLNTSDPGAIDALEAELADARSAQRAEEVLSRANQRLEQGLLLEPANDNARYLYELVLGNDPNNWAARQGLNAVAAKIVLNARAEIDAGNFSRADGLLTQAERIDRSSADLAATKQALADARAQKAAAERAAAEAAEAERLAAEAEAARKALPVSEQAPIPVSELTRAKYVAPKYPRAAERRGANGWVDVVFTVGLDGTVRDIDIRGSEPGALFVKSATNAVERWTFEPVVEDGQVVEKRAGVRLMFAIE